MRINTNQASDNRASKKNLLIGILVSLGNFYLHNIIVFIFMGKL